MNPPIYRKIREENPEYFPPEDALAHDLKLHHNFNPNAVPEFIRVINKTFEFAKVYESDIIPDINADYQRQEPAIERENIMQQPLASPQTSSPKPAKPLPAYVSGKEIAKFIVGQGKTISLIADGVITQRSIQKLIKMLEMNVEDFPANEEGVEPLETKVQ